MDHAHFHHSALHCWYERPPGSSDGRTTLPLSDSSSAFTTVLFIGIAAVIAPAIMQSSFIWLLLKFMVILLSFSEGAAVSLPPLSHAVRR
jgi:hypothetical protein